MGDRPAEHIEDTCHHTCLVALHRLGAVHKDLVVRAAAHQHAVKPLLFLLPLQPRSS